MKKSLCILCSTATALSLSACGTAQVYSSEAAETTTVSTEELTTVTGKVTEIGAPASHWHWERFRKILMGTPHRTTAIIPTVLRRCPVAALLMETAVLGGSSEVTQGDSANTITEDGTYTGTTYTSTGDDENALRVDGATVTIKNATLTANNSEALVIEGQNSIALENCDVIGNMSDTKGSSGSNGAQVEFTADSQTINGDIIVDNISTLDFSLTNGIVLNGTINFNGYTITLADGTVLK